VTTSQEGRRIEPLQIPAELQVLATVTGGRVGPGRPLRVLQAGALRLVPADWVDAAALDGGGRVLPTPPPRRRSRRRGDDYTGVARYLDALLRGHEVPVRAATRPEVPAPKLPSDRTLRRELRERARVSGDGGAWGSVWVPADRLADARAAVRRDLEVAHAERRASVERWWERLAAHDPPVVLARVDVALARGELPAVAVAAPPDEVHLVLSVLPVDDLVGTRTPSDEPDGTRMKRTDQARKHELYEAILASSALAVAATALAVAPAARTVRLGVVCPEHLSGPAVLALATLRRGWVRREGGGPGAGDLEEAVEDAASDLVVDRGDRLGALRPLDDEVPGVESLRAALVPDAGGSGA
jgi:hypothetical protein